MAARRNKRSGFTLIELMVVILILGILAGVAGVAVSAIIAGSKANLDATTLGKFVSQLQLDLEGTRGSRISRHDGKGKSAAELFQKLLEEKIMIHDHLSQLAGASGSKGGSADWTSKKADDLVSLNMIIFTAPNEGPTFFNRARLGRPEVDGAFMCYNENWFDKYPDKGMAICPAGAKEAKLFLFIDMKDFEQNSKKTAATITAGDRSFYGKFPFEGIAPK